MVIDEKFYVGRASGRSVIRMVRGIRRADRINRRMYRSEGDGGARRASQAVKRAVSARKPVDIYVITLPVFDDGILEIYNLAELGQRAYASGDTEIHIVGAAPTRIQAMLIVRDIVDDIYKKTGGVDVKGFFGTQNVPDSPDDVIG